VFAPGHRAHSEPECAYSDSRLQFCTDRGVLSHGAVDGGVSTDEEHVLVLFYLCGNLDVLLVGLGDDINENNAYGSKQEDSHTLDR